MSGAFLDGLRVVDLGDHTGRRACRALADLGADVVRVDVGRSSTDLEPARQWDRIWDCGKVIRSEMSSSARRDLLLDAHVIVASPGTVELVPADAAASVVVVSPYGLTGPRSAWRGSDLTCLAASGNLFVTGDPDRPPVRSREPLAYAQAAGDAVFAVLCAVASGRTQRVDVSVQEALISTLTSVHVLPGGAGDGERRAGVNIGRTKEVYRCQDGDVVFGIRGGPSRAHTWRVIMKQAEQEGIDVRRFRAYEWERFDHVNASAEELTELEGLLQRFFMLRTKAQLYRLGLDERAMIAPVVDAADVHTSRQLNWRCFFGEVDLGPARVPLRFARAWRADDLEQQVVGVTEGRSSTAAPGGRRTWQAAVPARSEGNAWAGLRILELGSGIAGPLCTRYFVEQGATCIKVESTRRPDVLRVYSSHPDGSALFANMNAGKWSFSVDMSRPEGLELVRRLINVCDAVVENFASRTLPKWGLDPTDLLRERPDLVVVRTSMWGMDGPDADYPGYGPQGTALSGYHQLTGWPDRTAAIPYGTVTDFVAPRYTAAALAAALLARRRDGVGALIDVSQIEVAAYCLSPWLYEYATVGSAPSRAGNRHDLVAPHGVFPTDEPERWVAIAVWADDEWAALCRLMDVEPVPYAELRDRLGDPDAVEALVQSWTSTRDADDVVALLQAAHLDAAVVLTVPEIRTDPQLGFRGHYVEHEHPVIGKHLYERSSMRFSDGDGGISAPGPAMGQHTDLVLRDVLQLSDTEINRLRDEGVLT